MIHQPYYIFQGIAFSGLSIYFFMNNFNYWAIGISALLALGSFGISTEVPKNKKSGYDTSKIPDYDTSIHIEYDTALDTQTNNLNLMGLSKSTAVDLEKYCKYTK